MEKPQPTGKTLAFALFHAEILKRNPSAHVLVVIKVVQICVDVLTVKMYMVLDYQPNLIVPRDVKKKKRTDPGYKRQRSCDFLATGGFEPSSGPWTNFECAVLVAVIKVLSFTLIGPTADNISKLFNYVVDSGHHSQTMPFKPSSKTMHQISGKLAHLERKKVVLNVL